MPPRIRTVEGSCWACKERRVICDLNKESCDKCVKIGRRCDYGKVRLRWTESVATRGRLANKKTPVYHATPSINGQAGLAHSGNQVGGSDLNVHHTTPGQMQIQTKTQAHTQTQMMQMQTQMRMQTLAPPVLRKTKEYHILYFEKELLPRFNISNTMTPLDLNILSKDPILLQSVVAVANAHAAYRSANESSLSMGRIQDRNDALKLFRQHLTGQHTNETNASLFIANVLLCILDGIVEPLTESSAVSAHLIGGKAILKQWTNVRDILQLKSELPVLMLSIFATMDLTHAMLIGDDPFFDASSWSDFGDCEAWWGNVAPDDDFLRTMAIISQLSSLGHGARNFRSTAPIELLYSIQIALESPPISTFNSYIGAPPNQLPGSAVQVEWAAFCSTYRFAASVYLFRALSALDVDHYLVQKAVLECTAIIAGEGLTDKLHHCILFPVLIIGTHCLYEGQRGAIRRSLAKTARWLSFEALRSMETFLEQRWRELDASEEMRRANWWKFYEEIAHVTCLF